MFLHVYREHINPSIRCGTEQPGLGDAPPSRQVEVGGERSAKAEGRGQAEGAFHSGIRNLSEAGSQHTRSHLLGDKGLVFALSPESTPPMGQLI